MNGPMARRRVSGWAVILVLVAIVGVVVVVILLGPRR